MVLYGKSLVLKGCISNSKKKNHPMGGGKGRGVFFKTMRKISRKNKIFSPQRGG